VQQDTDLITSISVFRNILHFVKAQHKASDTIKIFVATCRFVSLIMKSASGCEKLLNYAKTFCNIMGEQGKDL